MANRNAKDVKKFVNNVSKEVAEKAYDPTEYTTKEYVDTLMSGALKRAIVETLPVADIDTNTIYMVLDQRASQQGNVYNEYLYINNAWELIGTTATAGTLYEHNIHITGTNPNITDTIKVSTIIYSLSNTAFTKDTLLAHFENEGFTLNFPKPAAGVGTDFFINGIFKSSTFIGVVLVKPQATPPISSNSTITYVTDITDIVRTVE